ncbi:MAG: hypothetical protein F9K32_11185 [Desulfobulbaceae bacterium]|nr:MAG: hypothetical protein F9K32_11185 [Desulfobulbaceae bacterium]
MPGVVGRNVFDSPMEREAMRNSPTKEVIDILEEHPVFFTVIVAFLVIQADLLTGEQIEFPVLFTLPVALAAWGLKPYLAYGLAIALPLMRVGFVVFLWNNSQAVNILWINAIITTTTLVGYAYLIAKFSLKKKDLEAKVKILEENRSDR